MADETLTILLTFYNQRFSVKVILVSDLDSNEKISETYAILIKYYGWLFVDCYY